MLHVCFRLYIIIFEKVRLEIQITYIYEMFTYISTMEINLNMLRWHSCQFIIFNYIFKCLIETNYKSTCINTRVIHGFG